MKKKIVVEYCDLCDRFDTCTCVELGKPIGTLCPLPDDREDELRAALHTAHVALVRMRFGEVIAIDEWETLEALISKALGKEA
jgi:hypothetical protein